MKRAERPSLVLLIASIAVFILNWLCGKKMGSVKLGSISWCAITIAWIFRVRYNIVDKRVRRYLVLGGVMVLFLFAVRVVRYDLADDAGALERYLWYCYYIPFILLPLISLLMALSIGVADMTEYRKKRGWRVFLWTICVILMTAVFTNDLHGYLILFKVDPADPVNYIHEYGFLQYPIIAWLVTLSGIAFAVVMKRCKNSGSRKRWYIPASVFAVGSIMYAWYYLNGGNSPVVFGHKFYLIQEVCMILYFGVCEACISIGLIPSNSGYRRIFEDSDWDVVIADERGRKVLSSGHMDDITSQMLKDALTESQWPGKNKVLRCFRITRGIAGWLADVSEIERINSAIRENTAELENENAVIREEAGLKMKRAAFETQNRLYDSIIPIVTPQLNRIRVLLGEPDDRKIFMSMLLCIYVKRRFNLAIVTDNSVTADIGELWLAIRETTETLTDCGIPAYINGGGHDQIPAVQLLAGYDFFEDVIEQTMTGIHSIFINVLKENDMFVMRILVTADRAIRFDEPYLERMRRMGAYISDEREDDTDALSLSFMEGGDL